MISKSILYAYRRLMKNKMYTGINIISLSVGIAAIILIFKIIHHELSYNKNFKEFDNIVRVICEEVNPEAGITYTSGNPQPAMELMKTNIPQFRITARVKETWPTISVYDKEGSDIATKKFEITEGTIVFLTEPSYFEIFEHEWIAGDKKNALIGTNKIVLTKSLAKKCFGNIDQAMGKYISTDNQRPYLTVSGIVDDKKGYSDLPVVGFISYETGKVHPQVYNINDDWGSSNDQFFALVTNGTSLETVNNNLKEIGKEQYSKGIIKKKHIAQPLADLHFNEEVGHSGTHQTSKKKLKILSLIGLLIVVMACFNFINMANAQSITRAKEVGIRKTLGVKQGSLLTNFLTETSLVVAFSLSIGIAIAFLLTPYLYKISPLPKDLVFFDTISLIWFFIGILVLVTVLAGFYPGIMLSSFKPIEIFRSGFDKSIGNGVSLRKVLMVAQFVIAFGLILSTFIVMSQMNFIRNMDLGFTKDLVYTFGFNNDSASISKLGSFKQQLLQVPAIEKVSFSSDRPSSDNSWSSNWKYGNGPDDAPFNIYLKFCDPDYLSTYNLKLVAGRWMNPSDTIREIVLNQMALTKLGITDAPSAIGQKIGLGGRRGYECVGVIADYHSYSAHEPIVPTLMTTRKKFYYIANLKLKPENISTTISSIEKIYNQTFPDYVFNGRFYDEMIQNFYKADTQYYNLCRGFAILAIVISCLGLFALTSFTISRKVKEIGIRKVLGATSSNIIGLVSKEFLLLVSISILISAPLVYYFMNQWLQEFVYRTSIQWWMFAISIALIMVLAFLTIASQALKAALANPIKSLRME